VVISSVANGVCEMIDGPEILKLMFNVLVRAEKASK
jgi:hypothetical protein